VFVPPVAQGCPGADAAAGPLLPNAVHPAHPLATARNLVGIEMAREASQLFGGLTVAPGDGTIYNNATGRRRRERQPIVR
jgi:hypothetical protein